MTFLIWFCTVNHHRRDMYTPHECGHVEVLAIVVMSIPHQFVVFRGRKVDVFNNGRALKMDAFPFVTMVLQSELVQLVCECRLLQREQLGAPWRSHLLGRGGPPDWCT